MSQLQRVQVIYSGYVQGVGFRFSARRIAQAAGVAGFVKNLSNGNVLLVGEGTRGQLESFITDLTKRMSDHIGDSCVEWQTDTGEFETFEIRF
ncbi:MAG: acylphosphatase [Candidatus Omnitrophica bacterium]|nr:acylphosphatase [Candidatus Omnitrophota bacterium]MBU1128847.1 acylphosphatase [Candidatus Omnitrophota bacterium]MBU1783917.1 acylphosphatase [Candidatus Omnitrophota bacterium]MBU1852147.1 acylphosphatase [Candidatus Omnitrophota bacterium]